MTASYKRDFVTHPDFDRLLGHLGTLIGTAQEQQKNAVRSGDLNQALTLTGRMDGVDLAVTYLTQIRTQARGG